MPELISYAQNGEDVVLHRALSRIERGFYIDVGAYDPSLHSVTKLFYDGGWSGINVEPSRAMYSRLVSERQRDCNLNVALSDQSGELSFYQIEQTGLSTLDAAAAEKARCDGFDVEETRVQVSTLADVCRDLTVGEIHFLKIDVEGAERQVLLGADFDAFRPWIVVVEATDPGTSDRVDVGWRDLLVNAGYEPVLFDGLNLFFLAHEHSHLRSLLLAPANVTDRYVPVQHHAALLRLGALQSDSTNGDASAAIDGSSSEQLVAWHQALAREMLERELAERTTWIRADAEAAVRRSMSDTIAWNRADAEAAVRRSMDDAIAWHRADAEAAVRRSMQDAIAWHRADAEGIVRRSMDDTIAWHRADAAERAYRNGCELVALRMQDVIDEERRAKLAAVEVSAALRRLRHEQAREIEKVRHELAAWQSAVRTSTSWRLTRPLRVAMRIMKPIIGRVRRLAAH